MNTINSYGLYWGMHLLWWVFWIFAMITVFGFNVPERARINSLDPHTILKRRFAKGEISDVEYKKIATQLLDDEELVQKNISSQIAHTGTVGHPIIDGLSFSVTWAISYSLCALLYWIAPDVILSATSKLFHGLNFTEMVETGTTFSFSDFFSVLTLGAGYVFLIGIIWSLVHTGFLRQKHERQLKELENKATTK